MFKEKLKNEIDMISPAPELLDKVSLMMSEQAAKPHRSPQITAVRYAAMAAAVCLLAFGAVRLGILNRDSAVSVRPSEAVAAEAAPEEMTAAAADGETDEAAYEAPVAGTEPQTYSLMPETAEENGGDEDEYAEEADIEEAEAAGDEEETKEAAPTDEPAEKTETAPAIAENADDTADGTAENTSGAAEDNAEEAAEEEPSAAAEEPAYSGGVPSSMSFTKGQSRLIDEYPRETIITDDIVCHAIDRPVYSFKEAAARIAENEALSLCEIEILETLPDEKTELNFANGCTVYNALVTDLLSEETIERKVVFAGTKDIQEAENPIYQQSDRIVCETELIGDEMVIREYPLCDIYCAPSGPAAYARMEAWDEAGLKNYADEGFELVTTTLYNPARYYGVYDYEEFCQAFIDGIKAAMENPAEPEPETEESEEPSEQTAASATSGNLYVFRGGERISPDKTQRLAELCMNSAVLDRGLQLKMLLSDDDIDGFIKNDICVQWDSGSESFMILISGENSFMVHYDRENCQRVFALPDEIKAEVLEITG